MAEERKPDEPDSRPDAGRSLDRDIDRLERREPGSAFFWRSLSVLGTVGWSIALPAFLGAWLGRRLDVRFDTGVHFTLMLLVAGVMLGSAIAWRVLREHRK
ncbi:MAG: AtpZ/AtpI family protein [Myxococcota bacterium]